MTFTPLIIIIGLVLIDIAALIVWAAHEDRVMRGLKPLLAMRWSLLEIFLAIQAALILSQLPAGALSLILFAGATPNARMSGTWLSQSPTVLIGLVGFGTIMQQFSFYGAASYLIRSHYRLAWENIGFRPTITKRELSAGVLTGISFLLISPLIERLTLEFFTWWRGEVWVQNLRSFDTAEQIQKAVAQSDFNLVLIFGVIGTTAIIAPFCEEMLFRGLIFNALRVRFKGVFAILLSGLIFGLAHFSILGLPAIFILGSILAWMYARSGSLWVTIIAHATNNFILIVLAMLQS